MRLTFPKSHHLRRQRDFDAVYGSKLAKRVGPLRVHARANGLEHNRLGLSVGRRVGKATVRNRVKRLLRESFRLLQHELPAGYDLVVVVLPHEPKALEDYRGWLADAVRRLDAELRRRRSPQSAEPRNDGPQQERSPSGRG